MRVPTYPSLSVRFATLGGGGVCCLEGHPYCIPQECRLALVGGAMLTSRVTHGELFAHSLEFKVWLGKDTKMGKITACEKVVGSRVQGLYGTLY